MSLSSTLAIFLLWGWGADLGRLCVRASSKITLRRCYMSSNPDCCYLKPVAPPFLFRHRRLLKLNWVPWSTPACSRNQAAVLQTGLVIMASHSCQGLALVKFRRIDRVFSRIVQTSWTIWRIIWTSSWTWDIVEEISNINLEILDENNRFVWDISGIERLSQYWLQYFTTKEPSIRDIFGKEFPAEGSRSGSPTFPVTVTQPGKHCTLGPWHNFYSITTLEQNCNNFVILQ